VETPRKRQPSDTSARQRASNELVKLIRNTLDRNGRRSARLAKRVSDGVLQLRTAFSQQLLKRINQQAPAATKVCFVLKKAAYCAPSCFRSGALSHALLRLSPGASGEISATCGNQEDASVKQELLELAAVCEEVANEIDDQRTSG
jgi:hypothetical protein